MKNIVNYLFALLLIVNTTTICAQISHGGFPLPDPTDQHAMLKSGYIDEWIEMPTFDMSMVASDSVQLKIGGLQFAHAFKTDLTPQNSGTTTYLEDGTKVWRVKIRSTNALSINLIFNRYHLDGDSKLFLYSPDKSKILGAFTKDNNHSNNTLATSPIEGDEIVVELIEPVGANNELSIGTVNHGFRSLRSLPEYGGSAECQVDISCADFENSTQRSVALIIINGTTLCSGSLINNSSNDKTPYFLTAAHCVAENIDQYTINELASTFLFFFNYETPHCLPNIQGTMEMSLSGAEAVLYQPSNDLLLLKLNEIPPLEYNTYYAGWNISSSISGNTYCIHHPQGDVKKISLSKSAPTKSTFQVTDLNFNKNVHWLVDGWQFGLTEAGSSGSPLFDSNNRIIGALSGGYDPSGCNEANRDEFFRLNACWTNRLGNGLKNYLDPNNQGISSTDGLEPYTFHCERISHFYDDDTLHTSTDNEYVAGSNSEHYSEYAEKFNHVKGTLYGVYFIPEIGTYYDSDTISLKIYKGTNYPTELIHQQRVRISDANYSTTRGVQDYTIHQMMARDNYLHLDSALHIDTTFFIAFEISQQNTHPFALYATDKTSDSENTAYFKAGEEWHPFTDHALFHAKSSLMAEPLMVLNQHTDQKEVASTPSTICYPIPVETELFFNFTAPARQLDIYDVSGACRLSLSNPSNVTSVNVSHFQTGLYYVKVVYDNQIDIIKFIKQ